MTQWAASGPHCLSPNFSAANYSFAASNAF